jgi:uracil-DNA glycosylase
MVGANQIFEADLYASALEWWRDVGVDILVDGNPRDWLAAPAAVPVAMPAASPVRPDTLPDTLEAFLTWRTGPDAPDAGWGGDAVLASGPVDAEIMVLLDQPDRDDCAEGRLLSGAAGRLFDRMLAAVGLSRDVVYVAAVCVRRSATGRPARGSEAKLAEAAMHHLSLVRPKRLLLLGDAASRAVLASDASAARGILHRVDHREGTSDAVASFHPRLLLQRPAAKAEAWRDLRLLKFGDGN